MDIELLKHRFDQMGARAKVIPDAAVRPVKIDIARDRKGEYFELKVERDRKLSVDAIDLRPRERHLLLAIRDENRWGVPLPGGRRFLCGHDERAWFVAAVPEGRAASNVSQAMEALKPFQVQRAQEMARVRFEHRNLRHNAGFIRQGEWFFVPAPAVGIGAEIILRNVAAGIILRNEPLVRTGGKPHRAEFLCRTGGEVVYVDRENRAISEGAYRRLVSRNSIRAMEYTPRRRNMLVMVKGRIAHPDHKTVHLHSWHFVYMNTEHMSQAMRFVAFID